MYSPPTIKLKQGERLTGDEHPCYHCGEAILPGQIQTVVISGEVRNMCCPGCAAVASAICEYGLENYYQQRNTLASKANPLIPEELEKLVLYDHPKVQASLTKEIDEQLLEIELILEGISCPACSWLCESRLKRLNGMKQAEVNFSNHRALVRWDREKLALSDILKAIQTVGYQAHPYNVETEKYVTEKQRKTQQRNLGITGVLGMQVMMISIALYFGKSQDMEIGTVNIFHWINLFLTTPVFFLAGKPFFDKAFRDIKILNASMDLAVSLGLVVAYAASVINTVRAEGEVYFDTVVMFIFLISLSRYFEFMHRRKSIQESSASLHEIPAIATRINNENDEQETIAVAELKTNDILLIKPGEAIAADCLVTSGNSVVDESMITGESLPITKLAGDKIIAGTTNIESTLEARVQSIGDDTVVASIRRLIDRAHAEKPRLTRITDRVASWFIFTVICIALVTILYHGLFEFDAWLATTISILIVTCPCALSLATPTALIATVASLMKQGIVVKQSDALGKFSKLSHIIFDKTGTISEGKIQLENIIALGPLDKNECHIIAAAIESRSEHPVARALTNNIEVQTAAKQCKNYPGGGITASYRDQNYFLGNKEFIENLAGINVDQEDIPFSETHSTVLLADETRLLAAFILNDRIKPSIPGLIQQIKNKGITSILLSGDRKSITEKIARDNDFDQSQGQLLPGDKLKRLNSIQNEGGIVAMVGDGINDAPILAKADLSIAMGSGTDIAKLNADIILLNSDLTAISKTFSLVSFTRRIILQNICWAVLYNLIALPVAVLGYLQPWMAAIGMSLSSLIVIFNANRIRHFSLS